MKKLLYTSAIAGAALSFAVSAHAETKVTGNLGLSYRFVADDSTAKKSYQVAGKESQINISNSGDLNNGMKYAAGFSLEMDGGNFNSSTTSGLTNAVTGGMLQGQQHENTFIDLISGNTTISIGNDHFQNRDGNVVNMVGFGYLGGYGIGGNSTTATFTANPSDYQAFGIGVAQKTDIGSIGIRYVPRNTSNAYANDIFDNTNKANASDGLGTSTYELTFIGNLGVQGLSTRAHYAQRSANGGSTLNNTNSSGVDFVYKMGKASIAASRDTSNASGTTGDITSTGFGVAYALSDNMSIGYAYGKAEKSGTTVDEKNQILALGYNLGAVTLQVQARDVADGGNSSANDGKALEIYLGTKF